MRQNEQTILDNLSNQLKAIHPADIMGGVAIIREFALNQFHGGIDPDGENEHPIFKAAAEMWAYYQGAVDFPALLKDYAALLVMFTAYLWERTEKLSESLSEVGELEIYSPCEDARNEIYYRIARGLGLNLDDTIPDGMRTADCLDPVAAFLRDRPNAENLLNHWESAKREEPGAIKNPKPSKEPRKPQHSGFPLRLIPSSPSFSWRDALACVVAVCGAVLLEYICGPQPAWKHFAALLALLMVAAPVWKMATRYAKRRALVPITQPTQ